MGLTKHELNSTSATVYQEYGWMHATPAVMRVQFLTNEADQKKNKTKQIHLVLSYKT